MENYIHNENVIVENESVLGYVHDVKKFFEGEIKYLENEIANDLEDKDGNNEDFMDNIELCKELLNSLANENELAFICVQYNPMGAYFFEKVMLVNEETNEEIFM